MPLRAHFLNVGHGDCTVIEHYPSRRLTMIDINTSRDYDQETRRELVEEELRKWGGGIGTLSTSFTTGGFDALSGPSPILWAMADGAIAKRATDELTDPVEFIKALYPGKRLWRFILTHPDMDHMRGIGRLHQEIGFDNFWDTAHTKEIAEFRGNGDEEDWRFYQWLRGQSNRKLFTRGNSYFAFGREENGLPGGDGIEILSPSPELVVTCNSANKFNELSIVIRVQHAGRSILLPGDAEDLAWESMVAIYGPKLASDILKASHHGRDSGYHMPAVKHINPLMTIVSVGRKPDTDASNKYRNYSDRVVSTRFHGNIEIRIDDDGTCRWFPQRQQAAVA